MNHAKHKCHIITSSTCPAEHVDKHFRRIYNELVMKKVVLYFSLIITIACQLENREHEKMNSLITNQEECDCKWQNIDTVFSNGDYIKSVLVDSFCEVQIQIQKHRTILKRYECPLDDRLPQLFYHGNSRIDFYFYDSSGGLYITVCELVNDSIRTNWDARTYRCPFKDCITTYRVFVYKKPSDKKRIYCKGVFSNTDPAKDFLENNKEERSFKLPKAYWEEEIDITELNQNYLLVKFKSGKELKIKCNL